MFNGITMHTTCYRTWSWIMEVTNAGVTGTQNGRKGEKEKEEEKERKDEKGRARKKLREGERSRKEE